jgi:hypothetical protein
MYINISMYIYIYIYIYICIYIYLNIGNLRDDANSFFLSTEIFFASLKSSGKDVVTVYSTYDANVHCFNFEYTPQQQGIFELGICMYVFIYIYIYIYIGIFICIYVHM